MTKLILYLLYIFAFSPVLGASPKIDNAIDLGDKFEIKLRDQVVLTYNFLDNEDLPSIPGITPEQIKSTNNTKVLRNLMALDSGIRVYIRAYLLPNGYVKLTAKHEEATGTLYIPASNIISINTFKDKPPSTKQDHLIPSDKTHF